MFAPAPQPRLVVAGVSGDAGKTLVSLAFLVAARDRLGDVRAFKKGPDYIDAAWLGWASGRTARHLDTFLMGFPGAVAAFTRNAASGLNLVEGNRGVFDGVDARGTHSTAELAKALDAPVILAINATKMTRTAAALVAGVKALDPALNIAGVVVNQVAGSRHERVLRESIESACGVPVVGAIPKLPERSLLPERHLGLVTPEEHPSRAELEQELARIGREHLNIDRFIAIAQSAPPLPPAQVDEPAPARGDGLKIGWLSGPAFTFYYPENLEALERSGAELVAVPALTAGALPADLDALYIGGGFPETHAAELAANTGLMASLRESAGRGLAIYAECGGLMLLARSIAWRGARHAMAGVLPFEVEVCETPQGHGYAILEIDRPNAFYCTGAVLKGHEFHYSRIVLNGDAPTTAAAVCRGSGCFDRRDGITAGRVWAGYTHFHASATPEWAQAILRAASGYARDRKQSSEATPTEAIP